MDQIAVEVHNVSKSFPGPGGEKIMAVNNISLQIKEGEFFSLLGPSGCGKTTTLRMLAGFELPSDGEITIRGEPMGYTPPFKRPVNTVFQNYALWPHMTIYQNVAFGLQMARVPKDQIKRQVDDALELVQLPGFGDRRPSQLSGGQRQRVALARALVQRPAVLLLDEPLGALDLKLRKAMQFELKAMQQQVGITFIYVTHDQEEALTMSDRIAVMSDGNVLQVGEPEAIYERPVNSFVATFIGETNFLKGVVVGHSKQGVEVRVDDTLTLHAPGDDSFRVGEQVMLALRPEKLALHPGAEKLKDSISGEVVEAIYIGTDMRYEVKLTERSTVVVRMQNFGGAEDRGYKTGDKVKVTWSGAHARLLRE